MSAFSLESTCYGREERPIKSAHLLPSISYLNCSSLNEFNSLKDRMQDISLRVEFPDRIFGSVQRNAYWNFLLRPSSFQNENEPSTNCYFRLRDSSFRDAVGRKNKSIRPFSHTHILLRLLYHWRRGINPIIFFAIGSPHKLIELFPLSFEDLLSRFASSNSSVPCKVFA